MTSPDAINHNKIDWIFTVKLQSTAIFVWKEKSWVIPIHFSSHKRNYPSINKSSTVILMDLKLLYFIFKSLYHEAKDHEL